MTCCACIVKTRTEQHCSVLQKRTCSDSMPTSLTRNMVDSALSRPLIHGWKRSRLYLNAPQEACIRELLLMRCCSVGGVGAASLVPVLLRLLGLE
jgi:hypothetical protein